MSTSWDDLEQMFEAIDAEPANTMLIFDDVELADRYGWHTLAYRRRCGILVRAEDTRTGSGLLVQWRDPFPAAEVPRRQSEALWMLEQVIAGRVPRPEPGQITNVSADTEAARKAQIVGLS